MTAQVARGGVPQGCLAIRIRDGLGELFDDTQFAGLGRPALSPAQLALASVLGVRPGAVGPPSADAGRCRINWKCALGLGACRHRRRRLGARRVPLLQRMPARLRERGLLVRGGRQCTAASPWVASVRSPDRLELVIETVRAALEALAPRRRAG
jgi:hypothetical protein